MILVFAEQNNGNFKKATFEAIHYASKIAQSAGTQVCAVVLGEAANLSLLGNYGAQKVVHITDARLNNLEAKAYSKAISNIATQENAQYIMFLIKSCVNGRVGCMFSKATAIACASKPPMTIGSFRTPFTSPKTTA